MKLSLLILAVASAQWPGEAVCKSWQAEQVYRGGEWKDCHTEACTAAYHEIKSHPMYKTAGGSPEQRKEAQWEIEKWQRRTARTWIRKKVYILGIWSEGKPGKCSLAGCLPGQNWPTLAKCTCYDANATVDIGYDNAGATALDLQQEIEPIETKNREGFLKVPREFLTSKENGQLKALQAQLQGMKADCLPPPPPTSWASASATSFTASDCSVGKSYVMAGTAADAGLTQCSEAADAKDSFVSTTCSGATPICYVEWETLKKADMADPYAKDGQKLTCTLDEKKASCKSAEEAKAACAKFKKKELYGHKWFASAEAEEEFTALCIQAKCHLPYCVDEKAYELMKKRMETAGEQETCKSPELSAPIYGLKAPIWRSYEEICADCPFMKFSCNEEGGLDMSGALSTSLSAVAFVFALVAALQ